MRLFDTLTASEKQIVRYQCKQFMAHCRLFHAEVIPSIPTDDDDDGEIIPRAPATMQQQEEGWGYNEREFIGENMPTRGGAKWSRSSEGTKAGTQAEETGGGEDAATGAAPGTSARGNRRCGD